MHAAYVMEESRTEDKDEVRVRPVDSGSGTRQMRTTTTQICLPLSLLFSCGNLLLLLYRYTLYLTSYPEVQVLSRVYSRFLEKVSLESCTRWAKLSELGKLCHLFSPQLIYPN